MSAPQTQEPIQLHPLAAEASAMFLAGRRTFTAEAVSKLEGELEKLQGRPELGVAVASLLQVAQYLERTERARDASRVLLRVVLAQTSALESLNAQAELAREEQARRKRKAFSKFSGN